MFSVKLCVYSIYRIRNYFKTNLCCLFIIFIIVVLLIIIFVIIITFIFRKYGSNKFLSTSIPNKTIINTCNNCKNCVSCNIHLTCIYQQMPWKGLLIPEQIDASIDKVLNFVYLTFLIIIIIDYTLSFKKSGLAPTEISLLFVLGSCRIHWQRRFNISVCLLEAVTYVQKRLILLWYRVF